MQGDETEQPPSLTVEDIDGSATETADQQEAVPKLDAQELLERLGRQGNEILDLREENQKLKSRARTIDILDQLIEPYAHRTFVFMCIYCACVGFTVFLDGYSERFFLPTSVLEFLVGSTAVTVIGLVGMVLTGIFVTRPK